MIIEVLIVALAAAAVACLKYVVHPIVTYRHKVKFYKVERTVMVQSRQTHPQAYPQTQTQTQTQTTPLSTTPQQPAKTQASKVALPKELEDLIEEVATYGIKPKRT